VEAVEIRGDPLDLPIKAFASLDANRRSGLAASSTGSGARLAPLQGVMHLEIVKKSCVDCKNDVLQNKLDAELRALKTSRRGRTQKRRRRMKWY
jgi:hypothetical protein